MILKVIWVISDHLFIIYKKMKVIQFTPYFPPHKWGLEVVAENIGKYLVSGHHAEVINITSSVWQPKEKQHQLIIFEWEHIGYKINGYQVVTIPSFEIVHNFPCPKFWTKQFRNIMEYIKIQKADIIQTHTRFFLQTFMGGIIAKCLKIPQVHVEHGSGHVTGIAGRKKAAARLYDQTFGRLAFAMSDRIISINKKNLEFVSKFTSQKKCEIIYNGIEVPKIGARKESDSDDVKLVFVGRLIRLKWVRILLEACKILMEKWIEYFSLEIIWDGEEKSDLEHLMRRLRLQQYVSFLWAKNHDEIITEILPNTDILVNPSLQEWLPTTVLEWLLAGCVVVATNVWWTREISDQKDLVLVEAWNSKRLAEKLEYAIENYKELQWLSESHIKEKFNWENSAKKYAEVYTTLCK